MGAALLVGCASGSASAAFLPFVPPHLAFLLALLHMLNRGLFSEPSRGFENFFNDLKNASEKKCFVFAKNSLTLFSLAVSQLITQLARCGRLREAIFKLPNS